MVNPKNCFEGFTQERLGAIKLYYKCLFKEKSISYKLENSKSTCFTKDRKAQETLKIIEQLIYCLYVK